MKKLMFGIACAALLGAGAMADEVATTTTTTTTAADGTIEEYAPGSTFVLKEKTGPRHYRYGKSVTYVTHEGREIPEAEVRERIRVGAPVHVHYRSEGDDRVIDRVELDR